MNTTDPRIAHQQCALAVAKEAMEAFTDPHDQMPAKTGEFNNLKIALVAVRQVLPLCDEYLFGQAPSVLADLDRLKARNAELVEVLEGLVAITKDSHGITGYHLNGSVANWDEFEEVSQAEAALTKHQGEPA